LNSNLRFYCFGAFERELSSYGHFHSAPIALRPFSNRKCHSNDFDFEAQKKIRQPNSEIMIIALELQDVAPVSSSCSSSGLEISLQQARNIGERHRPIFRMAASGNELTEHLGQRNEGIAISLKKIGIGAVSRAVQGYSLPTSEAYQGRPPISPMIQ
jgi:hypothetical protein